MKLVAVLLGLMLATLSYSEDNCRESIDKKALYYIYNTSVEINAYYCSYSTEEYTRCINSNNGKLVINSKYIQKWCKLNFFDRLSKSSQDQHITKLCEIPALVNLLDDIFTLSDNNSCWYSHGKCYYEKKFVFWTVTDIYKYIYFIYENTFNPLTKNHDNRMFLKDDNISLILTEKLQFSNVEVWKTNHDGIIVSKNKLPTTNPNKAQLSTLQSNLTEFCEGVTNNQQSAVDSQNANNVSKIWYVYKYPTDVTIHTCLLNDKIACKDSNLGETVSKNNLNLLNQCKDNFCDPPSCRIGNSEIMLCRTTLHVDLETNSIIELPSECKYSEGLCKSWNTFWQYTDRCDTIKIAYKGYETMCGHRKCVTQDNSPTLLILSRQGFLCGETVWYTDQNGLVASERELQFTPSKTSLISPQDEMYENDIDGQNDEIDNLQNLLYCLFVGLVVFCGLWYVFNVIVNFSSLRKLNKTRTSSEKICLLYCLSQSLTAHQLCLSHREKELIKVVANVQAPQVYESVNNELYNKPIKLPLQQ